jgi:hypothetical protein
MRLRKVCFGISLMAVLLAGVARASQDQLRAGLENAAQLQRLGKYGAAEKALLGLLRNNETLGPGDPRSLSLSVPSRLQRAHWDRATLWQERFLPVTTRSCSD